MHATLSLLTTTLLTLGLASGALASEGLPDGPIHDRHELMEDVGKEAKKVGDALKSGDTSPVAGAATEIARLAGQASAMFPEGSLHEKSRARAEIWQDWEEFDRLMTEMETKATALASAASSEGDVGAAAKAMFGTCKSCHDQFRAPEDDED